MGGTKQIIEQRGLPANVDAERFLLGSIIANYADASEIAASLEPDDFSLDRHRILYRHMLAMRERGDDIGYISLTNELQQAGSLEAVGGMSGIVNLTNDCVKIGNLEGYCRIVKRKATLRNTIFAAQKLMDACFLETDEPSDLIETASSDLRKLYEDAGTRSDIPSTIGEQIMSLPCGFDSLFERRKVSIRTPWAGLNNMLLGGFRPQQLIILAARPAVGKTTLALALSLYAAAQHRIRFFSLEMSKEELFVKTIANQANLEPHSKGSAAREAFLKAAMEISEHRLEIDDKSFKLGDISRFVRRAKPPYELLVVDYLQLMTVPRAENRNLEIGTLTRSLKMLAKEKNLPILLLSQLNRAPETQKRKPMLSDLRDSGSIEQDADIVMFENRELVRTNSEREVMSREVELIIAKHRNGPTGSVFLRFHPEVSRFEEIRQIEERTA